MTIRIAAYTIALNEAKPAERWARSVAEADCRIVADTGSTDGTPELLEALGVTVYRIGIRPWRFDDARNAALALVPADVDVCISLDMDAFMRPGWRAAIEAAWTPEATRLEHLYQINVHADGSPAHEMNADRVHARWRYRWKRAVHEHLVHSGGPEVRVRSNAVMAEIQDHAKESRARYLPLLELAAAEDPNDSQVLFWLGRELVWAGKHLRAAEVLKAFLALPSSSWGPERSEAMIYLSKAEPEQRGAWLERAVIETPYRRETWAEIAEFFHDRQDWLNLYWACASGLQKGQRTGSYLDRGEAWGPRLFDLGALACWHLGLGRKSVEWGEEAVRMAPGDERLRSNLATYRKDAGSAVAAVPV